MDSRKSIEQVIFTEINQRNPEILRPHVVKIIKIPEEFSKRLPRQSEATWLGSGYPGFQCEIR